MLINPFLPKKYLVIDDFGEMRNMIKGLLRTLGASDIDGARNAREALQLIREQRYDVVLCDYNLGAGQNGQQFLEEVRHRNLIDLSVVFIMITAENTRDMVMAAVEYEPDSYLSKPFTKDLLGTRLNKLFERKDDLLPVYTALRHSEYKKALTLLEQKIASKPKNLPYLIRLRADSYYDVGLVDKAGEFYQKLLNARDLPWARLGLGKVQFKKKAYDEAAKHFRYLVKHTPSLIIAHDWLAKTQRAMGLVREAQDTLQNAVKLSPKVMNRQQALGELAMQNEDYELAESTLTKAAQLGKFSVYNNPQLHANLAKTKSATGKHDEALQIIEGIGKNFEAVEAKFFAVNAEAIVRQNQGDEQAASSCMEKAQQLHQSLGSQVSPETTLELAQTAAQLGQKEVAQDLLESAVRNNHENEEILQRTAQVYQQTGLSEDGAATVNAIRQEVIEMNDRGVKLIAENHYPEAIELFTQAAQSLTGNLVINLNAARALVLQMENAGPHYGNMKTAREYIDRARRLAPGDQRVATVLKRYAKLASNNR